jgi:DNA-binding CsgD family transcriptional regulator
VGAAQGRITGLVPGDRDGDGPGDASWHRITATLACDEDLRATLVLARPAWAGAFGEEETARLDLLVPHFQHARDNHRALRLATLRADAAASFVESLDNPVILFDGAGRVTLANGAARRLAASGALSLRGGRFALARPADEGRLRACIARATAARGREPTERGAIGIAVRRPAPQPPLRFAVCPLPSGETDGGVALIGLCPGEDRPLAPLVGPLFDLTAAEARLVDQLRRGLSLQEAADALGVARSTTRSQLAAVFAKTGTSRQADLIGMLGRVLSLHAPI